MEKIDILEVAEDISGTQVIVGKDFDIKRGFGELCGVGQARVS